MLVALLDSEEATKAYLKTLTPTLPHNGEGE